MATISSQSTRTSGRAQSYAKKDAVAISAVNATVQRFEQRLKEIRAVHGKDGMRQRIAVDEDGKPLRDENGELILATDSKGNAVYEAKYVEAYALVQSFGHDELDPDDPGSWTRANELGRVVAEDRFPGRPALIATEVNGRSGCVHNHIIVGSIHPETGRSLDSNVVTHSRLAIAHDRVLTEQGFAQRADMREAVEKAERQMSAAREQVMQEHASSGISGSHLRRKLTAAENKVTVQSSTTLTASQERESRRQREYERYILNERERDAALEVDAAPPPQRFSEIVLESRIKEALDDPRALTWQGLGDAGREHGVTVERRGNDVVYGMMLAGQEGTLSEPARAHRRRGKSLGQGFRVEDVESAFERNALESAFERNARPEVEELLDNDRRGYEPDRPRLEVEAGNRAAGTAPDAPKQTFEEMLAEAKRERGFDVDDAPRHEERPAAATEETAGRAHESSVPVRESQPERPSEEPPHDPVEFDREPAFRSKLRDVKSKSPSMQRKLEGLAELEEDYLDRAPDARFEERIVDSDGINGVGSQFLARHGGQMDDRFRDQLQARNEKRHEANRAHSRCEQHRETVQDLQSREDPLGHRYGDRISDAKWEQRFEKRRVDRIRTEVKDGVYEKNTPAARAEQEVRKQRVIDRASGIEPTDVQRRVEEGKARLRGDRESARGRAQSNDNGLERG